MNPARTIALLAASLMWTVTVNSAGAGEKQAVDLLPPSTLVYAELPQPARLVSMLLDHPLYQKLAATPQSQAAMQTPQYQQLQALRTLLEQQLGTDWRTAMQKLTGGGVYAGFDAATQGAVLLVKAEDPTLLAQLRDTLVNLTRLDAASKGQPDPIQSSEYRGITGYRTGPVHIGVAGSWLVISNKPGLSKWIVDSYLDSGRASLASDAGYQAARAKAPADLAGWAYARIGTLRTIGIGRGILASRHGNPGAELLVGGVLAALGHAEYATLELKATPTELRLAGTIPHDPAKIPQPRQFFFAPADEGSAPRPLRPEGTILAISAYRDVAAMWTAAPDLFDENVATQLAQTDSGLSNFFGGRSFSGDVLGQIEPRFQFLVVHQTFNPAVPAVKLPGLAMTFSVQDPQVMTPLMQIAFQTIVALGNIGATMQGGPTLMIHNEKKGDVTLVSASYLAMVDQKSMTQGPIYFNFSPTMVLVGKHVIIGSTRALAEKLGELALAQGQETIESNTLVELNAAPALAALRDNRSQLVAQSMIQQGTTKEQAEQGVDLLLEGLTYLRSIELKLTPEADTLRVEAGIHLKEIP